MLSYTVLHKRDTANEWMCVHTFMQCIWEKSLLTGGRANTMRTSFKMMPYFHGRQKIISEQVNQLSTYKKFYFVRLKKRTHSESDGSVK